jgi:hypothetical protein
MIMAYIRAEAIGEETVMAISMTIVAWMMETKKNIPILM